MTYRILSEWLSFIPRDGGERTKAFRGEVRADLPKHGTDECDGSCIVEGPHDWLLAQGLVGRADRAAAPLASAGEGK